jgi:hypothetical protein
MVILNNIKLNNMGIECDYDPEKSGKIGHIILKQDGNADIRYSDYEYGKQTYAKKVIAKLESLMEDMDNIPNHTAVTWY